MNPILLHINYFEPHCSLAEACRLANGLGVDGIEFRRKRHGVNDDSYLDELSAALEPHAFTAISFGTPGVNLMLADAGERERELAAACLFYEKAATRFPLTVVNLQTGPIMNADPAVPGGAYSRHGSAAANESHWEAAIAGLRCLADLGGDLGVAFALETHPCYLHDTLEASSRLVEAVNRPAMGLLWDQSNFLLLSEKAPSSAEACERIGERLASVHLKNFLLPPANGDLPVSALSDGIINIREQVACLQRRSYAGPICLESPRQGDRQWFARQDLFYLRSLLEQ